MSPDKIQTLICGIPLLIFMFIFVFIVYKVSSNPYRSIPLSIFGGETAASTCNYFTKPEVDSETNCYIGYKWLYYANDIVGYDKNDRAIGSRIYYSHYNDCKWYQNERRGVFLKSDRPPTSNNNNGIYTTHRIDDEQLRAMENIMINTKDEGYDGVALVKLLLWGKYVMGEYGMRAEYARIDEVICERKINHGHWKKSW